MLCGVYIDDAILQFTNERITNPCSLNFFSLLLVLPDLKYTSQIETFGRFLDKTICAKAEEFSRRYFKNKH